MLRPLCGVLGRWLGEVVRVVSVAGDCREACLGPPPRTPLEVPAKPRPRALHHPTSLAWVL